MLRWGRIPHFARDPAHDRMPIVLEPADWPVWLGEKEGDPKTLPRPAIDTVLRTWPVSTDVNRVRHSSRRKKRQ